MSDGLETPRGELRNGGRNIIKIAAPMFALGSFLGSSASVWILMPFLPDVLVAQSLVVGMSIGILGGMILVGVYHLVEGRLIEMYLEAVGDGNRGETA